MAFVKAFSAAGGWLVVPVLIVSMSACAERTVEVQASGWIDPVHEVGVSGASEERVPVAVSGGGVIGLHVCHERSRYGVRLASNSTYTLRVPERDGNRAASGRLSLSGCTMSPSGSQEATLSVGRRLASAVQNGVAPDAESGTPSEFESKFTIPVRGWWSERELRLDDLDPGTEIELRFEAAADSAVLLDSAYLEVVTSSPVQRPESEGRLVIVLSLDTLRETAIAALGCNECSTPNLDKLVAESELFLPHYAAASWTKPAHASLLSGLLPAGHGSKGLNDPITTKLKLLAETFSDAGFSTTGIVSDVVWLDPKFGFSRGFTSYSVVPWSAGQKFRAALNDAVSKRNQDHFLFVHTFEPHSDFHSLPYEGINGHASLIKERFGLENYGCRDGLCAAMLLVAMRDGVVTPLPNEEKAIRFLYNAGVTEVDTAVGELMNGLRLAGLWDQTLLVVTSDHGEALLEHGRVEHGTNWEQVLRVPMMIKWPNGASAGEVVRRPSSAIDLMPTLLTAMQIEVPDHLLGHPLQELAEGQGKPVFSGGWDRVLWHEGLKLSVTANGKATLYDLAQDPAELNDLASQMPERVAELKDLLERRGKAAKIFSELSPGVELTALERARLEALGYL